MFENFKDISSQDLNLSILFNNLYDNSYFIITVLCMLGGLAYLNTEGRLALLEECVGRDRSNYRLSEKLIAQYKDNKHRNYQVKKSYNSYPPYSFFGHVDAHLTFSEQIQVAKILDRDLSRVYKQDFNIIANIGSVKWQKSGCYIAINIPVLTAVVKAEMAKTVPV